LPRKSGRIWNPSYRYWGTDRNRQFYENDDIVAKMKKSFLNLKMNSIYAVLINSLVEVLISKIRQIFNTKLDGNKKPWISSIMSRIRRVFGKDFKAKISLEALKRKKIASKRSKNTSCLPTKFNM
jgi:hypothetical protein